VKKTCIRCDFHELFIIADKLQDFQVNFWIQVFSAPDTCISTLIDT